jgi:hypothetical protein
MRPIWSCQEALMASEKSVKAGMKPMRTFLKVGTCSEALFNVLDRSFGHPMTPEENAAMPLAGGIMQSGYQCGMIWGTTLAAGAEAYRRFGPGPEAEAAAICAAGRAVEIFRTRHGEINCLEITGIDKSASVWKMINVFLIRGKTIGCLRMSAWFAPLAYAALDSALRDLPRAPEPPVSCTALLARKMGASDKHATMAAGLAGGIGLCGGACGALGAVIWLRALQLGEQKSKIGFNDERIGAIIDRFQKQTGYRYECSEIAGRKFEGADDHAGYLRDGGCRDLIEALAAT